MLPHAQNEKGALVNQPSIIRSWLKPVVIVAASACVLILAYVLVILFLVTFDGLPGPHPFHQRQQLSQLGATFQEGRPFGYREADREMGS